jgi:hypothetical protein
MTKLDSFERNQHGHAIITFIGLDLTGAEEVKRLGNAGYRLRNYAEYCFTSKYSDGYDQNHRLIAGQVYKIALVRGNEIRRFSDRTSNALLELGRRYGYGTPCGGHVPRIRETLSDQQMEQMGICYIASLHQVILDFNGRWRRLGVSRLRGHGSWVSTGWDDIDARWDGRGAFAFPFLES